MKNNCLTLDVSIIIVNYNTKQLLADCLNSIYEQTKDINFEVIVSDNGSKDGSIEMLKADFPQVILIENNANLGFGAANNRGLAIAKGKYIFYLNSDTILLNNAVKCFFDYWEENGERENIGALGCNLIDTNGIVMRSDGPFPNCDEEISSLIHNIYVFFKLFIHHTFFKRPLPNDAKSPSFFHLGEVDHVAGADLFLKNDENAWYDEDFFMYREEVYLEFLLAQQGKKRLLIDGPRIVHLEGQSAIRLQNIDIIRHYVSFSSLHVKLSNIIYFRKTYVKTYKIFFLKILTFIFWLNPYIFPSSKVYLKSL